MSFQCIRDQEIPIRFLRNLIARNRIPNAMMFWGPSGVGKRLAAMEMAKAVNCVGSIGDACDACLSCRKVRSGNHPDVMSITPVKKSRVIDVDTIESVNEMASLRPYESKWHVFILLDAERMNGPAQNHFLKTLEEPPGNSLFILVTEYPRALLPTIRSRCQMVRFGTLRPETVFDLLQQERDLPRDLAESIGALAQGQMSRALDLADSERRNVVLDITKRLAEGIDPVEVAEEFSAFIEDESAQIEAGLKAEIGTVDREALSREDIDRIKQEQMALVGALRTRNIMEYLYLFVTWYRDVLVYRATGGTAYILNKDQSARLKSDVTGDLETVEKKIKAIEKARRYLERFLKEDRVFRDLFLTLAQ